MSVIKFLVEFVSCLAEILLSRPGDYEDDEDDHLAAAQRAAIAPLDRSKVKAARKQRNKK